MRPSATSSQLKVANQRQAYVCTRGRLETFNREERRLPGIVGSGSREVRDSCTRDHIPQYAYAQIISIDLQAGPDDTYRGHLVMRVIAITPMFFLREGCLSHRR